MFRPKLLFTSLAAVLLGACAPPDRQAQTSAAIANQVILPTYTRWLEADRQLAVSALAFCSGSADLETARADFLHAQRAWAQLQPLLIGPLAEGNRSWSVQFWPDKKNLVGRQVEQLLEASTAQADATPAGLAIDAAALAKASVVVQGLSAYEYILYDSKPELADPVRKARYCPLLTAIGERQQILASEVLEEWHRSDGMLAQMSRFPNPRYADSHEAIGDVLRAQVTALDTLKKKLGTPLGRQTKGSVQPFQAEYWRSHASLASLEASLVAAQSIWTGVDNQGLRGLLSKDEAALVERIDGAYADALKMFGQSSRSLTQALTEESGRQQLNQLYDCLNVVHRLHEGELARALNIHLGFNANDGD